VVSERHRHDDARLTLRRLRRLLVVKFCEDNLMPVLPAENQDFPISIPLVIIGAGACGAVAALAAHERGVEVVILERDPVPRGSTSLSGGQIPAAGTKLQKAAGIDDSAEILEADIIAKAKGQCDRDIAKHVAHESAKTIDWLVERYKLPLSCISDFIYPGHSRMHMHASPSRFGAELMAVLSQAVTDQNINTITSAHVVDFYADKDGKIRGVGYVRPDGARETVGCDALILACNGYGGNPELVRRYIPGMAATKATPCSGVRNWARRSRTWARSRGMGRFAHPT
jgi:fumarate reductase flavoprotein subunit